MIETKVTWRGSESVAAVEVALRECGRAEIRLPADYHHVLCRSLGTAGPGALERLDLAGGSELLERVSRIGGLSELALLSPCLAGVEAEVRVVSPSPMIDIMIGGSHSAYKRASGSGSVRDRP